MRTTASPRRTSTDAIRSTARVAAARWETSGLNEAVPGATAEGVVMSSVPAEVCAPRRRPRYRRERAGGRRQRPPLTGRPSFLSLALRVLRQRELGPLLERVIPARQLRDDGELPLLARRIPILFDLHRLACAEHSRLHCGREHPLARPAPHLASDRIEHHEVVRL